MRSRPRRAHDRLPIELDVTVDIDGKSVRAKCLNISQGGMFIATELVPIGEQVRVSFQLPDLSEPIETEARVCWTEREGRRGIGIQFVGLRAIEVWAINQLFRRASREGR